MLFRPWLIASGVCFGLAIGTKWAAAWPLAAFGLMVWFWSAGARRSFGVRWPIVKSALVDGVPAFFSLVIVAVLAYIATWGGWLANSGEYEEHLSATQYRQYTGHGHCAEDDDSYIATDLDESKHWATADEKDASGIGEAWQSLRSLWYYHQDVYTFHTHFLQCSTHTYQSKPSSWLLINRPVGVAVTNDIQPAGRDVPDDEQDLPRDEDCDAPEGSDCIRQVLLIGTPMIWWGGCIALLFSVADVDRRARLEVRRRRRRHAHDLAAVDAVRRPTDLLLLRDRDPPLHRDRADAVDRHPHRTLATPVDPTHDRGGGERCVRRTRAGELRLVLADLDQRPADQQRVARPDLVLEMGVTMSRKQLALIAVGVALVVAVVAFLLTRDDDDKDSAGADPQPSASTSPSTNLPVVADETWCAGWQNLVATQGLYVAGPNPEAAANLLAAVDALQELGVPESLDPSGYTELTAVLDDVHASVDPSFTPTAVPSEPADVGEHHDHADEGHADDDHEEAPFGTWLADYCAA